MAAAVVLVEGPSDAAALRVLARRLGLDAPGVEVVSMGGATNVHRYLRDHRERPGTTVAGLCDRAEARFVAGALRRLGHPVDAHDELAAHGFFVCDDDLEDELIRALGTAAVIDVIEREGELDRLRTFLNQPYQRTPVAARAAPSLRRNAVGPQGPPGRRPRRGPRGGRHPHSPAGRPDLRGRTVVRLRTSTPGPSRGT